MFSPDNYPEIKSGEEIAPLSDRALTEIGAFYKLQAAMLVKVDFITETLTVAASFNIPPEPFNGTESQYLKAAIEDCFSKHASAHIHGIKDLAISGRIKRFNSSLNGLIKMWFIPHRIKDASLIFLGFPLHDAAEKKLPDGIMQLIATKLEPINALARCDELEKRLGVTEIFTKEVGHDVASSVQAILAKAKSITQRRVEGETILKRAKEIELEILSIQRLADALGIAVDRNYQVKEWDDFDISDSTMRVSEHFRSEAEERNITITLTNNKDSLPLYGDKRAIEHAIGQVLLNAIKYAVGNSSITVRLIDEGDVIRCDVANLGIPLPEMPAQKRIWEFGVRSKQAKEYHVNGSGIGLYTVKKIILAHHGTVSATSKMAGERYATVCIGFRIPKKENIRASHYDEMLLGPSKVTWI